MLLVRVKQRGNSGLSLFDRCRTLAEFFSIFSSFSAPNSLQELLQERCLLLLLFGGTFSVSILIDGGLKDKLKNSLSHLKICQCIELAVDGLASFIKQSVDS